VARSFFEPAYTIVRKSMVPLTDIVFIAGRHDASSQRVLLAVLRSGFLP